MSYDIWLETDTGGPELACVEDVGNYTSNVSPMWTKALGVPLGEFHGRAAGDCVAQLREAVQYMRRAPSDFTPMNPENGWGDYPGALHYLERLLAACERHPKTTIAISR